MKKIFFALAALVLAFTGCSQEEDAIQVSEKKAVKVVVNMDKPGFGEDTRAPRQGWEDGDEVVVTLDNLLAYYCLKLTYDGTSKKWTTTVMEPNMRTGVFGEGDISNLAIELFGDEDETEVSGRARAAYFSSGISEIVYTNLSSAVSTRASSTFGLVIVTNAGNGCSWKGDTPSMGDRYGECIMTCVEGGRYTLKDNGDSYELTLDITMQPMVAQFTIRDLKVEDDWTIFMDAPVSFVAGGYFTERSFYMNQIEFQSLGYNHQNGNDISIYAVPWQSNYDIPSFRLPDGKDYDDLEEDYYTTITSYYFNIYDNENDFEREFGEKAVEIGDAVIMDGPYTKKDGVLTAGAQEWY